MLAFWQMLRQAGQGMLAWRPSGGQTVAGLFLLCLFVNAVAVSYTTFRVRQSLAHLQALEAWRDQLQAQWTQLLLEEHAWGAFTRIGQQAQLQLQMHDPSPQSIVMVRP